MSSKHNIEKKYDTEIFNILLIGYFLFTVLNKDISNMNIFKKLSLKEINIKNIERKSLLLNRIKGYMDTEEQRIMHRAEIILQLIGNVKLLFETNEIMSAEVKYNSLSLDDRKRNMLMDLCEFVHEDKKNIIHQAIDLDIQAKIFGNKIKGLQELNTKKQQLSLEHIEKYFDIFEPFLDQEISDKVREGKRLLSMLKVYKSIEEKGEINELDIIEFIKPYIPEEQRENIGRMIEIMKVVSAMSSNEGKKEESNLLVSGPSGEVDKK